MNPISTDEWAAAQFLLVSVAIVSLLGFLSSLGQLFELISHFRVQYTALLGVGSILAFAAGSDFLAGLLVVVTAINFWQIRPFLPTGDHDRSPVGSELMLCNVRMRNEKYHLLVDAILEHEPDLVGLVEVDTAWLHALKDLQTMAGYDLAAIPRDDSYGLALLTKRKVLSWEQYIFPDGDATGLICRLGDASHPLHVILVHLPPPLRNHWMQMRDAALDHLGQWLSDQPGNWLVMGDLNLSPWSPQIRAFCDLSRLHSFRERNGVFATWPDQFAPIRIPLDHVFGSKRIEFGDSRIGSSVGSDHLPVWIDFLVKGGSQKSQSSIT